MLKGKPVLASLCALVILAMLALPVLAAPGDTTRVSVSSSGMQGNQDSFAASISPNGRYVGFISYADNLVPGVGGCNVFVHDRQTGKTTAISVASDGTHGNDCSELASFSADGRYVAFESGASNLVAGDTNGYWDVFVHDQHNGATERVSVATDGTQGNGHSYSPSISADGRYVAFQSEASTLVAGDTNGHWDIFIHDRQTGITLRVSVASDGTQGNQNSLGTSMSADGRYVVFESWANNLVDGDTNQIGDAFLHDCQTGATMRISVASDGTQGNEFSESPSISANGRYVALVSGASNLVSGDTNGTWDVFLHDLQTGETRRISVNSNGAQANDWSDSPSLSADGRYVAFHSKARNLVPGDTNAAEDVFVRDLQTGLTWRASVASYGAQADNGSTGSSISADGRYVVFDSYASNLVTGDTNKSWDIFVHENDYSPAIPTPSPTPRPASLPSTGFAPGRRTILSAPATSYISLGDLWLDVPRLGLQMPIVGVPYTNGSWDVSWLGRQAGWLNGSAYPTWSGNSVLTGHIWNADNTPGLFAYVNQLGWGDKVIIHAGGAQYVYEVRSVQQVPPGDMAAMLKHE